MKIQDLPQPYRALAEMRREQQIDSELFIKEKQHFIDNFNKNNELQNAFNWQRSAEKHDFWAVINMGGIPKSLAEIPAESLSELKEWQKEHPEYDAVLIAEQPSALKKAWDEGRLRTIEMLNAGNSTNPLINKDYCMALNPYGEIKAGNDLHEAEADPRLFTAAVAAMQGMLFQNFQGSNEDMSNIAWDIAESLINEGKKRNLL